MEDGTDSNIIIDGTIVTDDGSDVMLVNESPIYVLNGGTNETYERRLAGISIAASPSYTNGTLPTNLRS